VLEPAGPWLTWVIVAFTDLPAGNTDSMDAVEPVLLVSMIFACKVAKASIIIPLGLT